MQLKHIFTSIMIISLIGYSHSTIGQNLFNKELDFTSVFSRNLMSLYPITILGGDENKILYETYYLILNVKNGAIDSIKFSENTTEKILERYNPTFLDELNSKIKEMEIEFRYDCSILIPVFKYWAPDREHANKIENILESLFPINETFGCIHIAKPLILRMMKAS